MQRSVVTDERDTPPHRDDSEPDRDGPRPEPLPLWYERGLVVVTAAVLGYGGFGLLLAVIGIYHFAAVLAVGTLLAVGLSWLAWPRRGSGPGRRPRPQTLGVTLPAVAVCLVGLGSMAWNGLHSGQHVAIGRDPGIYANTGKWIATRGNLEMRTGTEWTSKSDGVTTVFGGSYAEGPDSSQFQFDHLTATLLAEGDNLAGDRLLFRMPAILGALGLCAIYAAGCRIVRRPWLVLAAVAGVAVSLPQLNVSRDTFSETSVQILLWAGIALLAVAYERRRPGMALLGGAALGGTLMSRIDTPVYLIPVPLIAAVAWISARSVDERRNVARTSLAVLAGAVPVSVLAVYDVQHRAGHYYDDLHTQVHQMQEGLAASVAVAVVLLGVWALRRKWVGRAVDALRRRRTGIGWVLGAATTVGLLLVWLVRPLVSTVRSTPLALIGALQARQHLPVDPGRTYAEHSVWWFSWYVGPAVVALFCLGAGLLVARQARRIEAAAVLALGSAGIGTGLYLWKPSIVPDQIWAMRRFVPAGLPIVMLLAAAAIAAIADASRRRARSLAPAFSVLGAVALVVPAAVTTWPVRNFVPGPGDTTVNLAGINVLCRAVGSRAAVLTAYGDAGSQEMVGPIRTWCEVPVASMARPLTAPEVDRLAAAWKSQGRVLWIIGSTATAVAASDPSLHPSLLVKSSMPRELELTVEKAPSGYGPVTAILYGSAIPAP